MGSSACGDFATTAFLATVFLATAFFATAFFAAAFFAGAFFAAALRTGFAGVDPGSAAWRSKRSSEVCLLIRENVYESDPIGSFEVWEMEERVICRMESPGNGNSPGYFEGDGMSIGFPNRTPSGVRGMVT